jgi:iron complex outermembrane receptor protein
MSYLSYARGYKGQGYDISSGFNQSRVDRPIKAEDSNAYELGLKSRMLDNRLQLNAALFLTDYSNFQAQSVVVLPSGAIQLGVNNVGKLRTQGVEVEFNAQATANLRIDASAAFTDAKIKEFPTANCYTGQTVATGCHDVDGAGPLTNLVQDLAGKRLANAPTSKFSLAMNYTHSLSNKLDGNASLDYQYQSDVGFDLFQNPRAVQSSYGVLNGNVGIRTPGDTGYRVSAFVNNITDKRYVTTVGDAGGASPIGNTLQILPRNARRYFGLKFGYQF